MTTFKRHSCYTFWIKITSCIYYIVYYSSLCWFVRQFLPYKSMKCGFFGHILIPLHCSSLSIHQMSSHSLSPTSPDCYTDPHTCFHCPLQVCLTFISSPSHWPNSNTGRTYLRHRYIKTHKTYSTIYLNFA